MTMFRYPNITALSEKEQLHQLKSYLYQLVEQLNHTTALVFNENGSAAPGQTAILQDQNDRTSADFAALKGLIIRSADIVEAYSQKIQKDLQGQYVALSEFGSYTEKTASQITANSQKIDQNYTALQQVVTDLKTRLLETAAYIRTGVLFYAGEEDPLPNGAPVYGMEIGQQTADGEFRRFSRFTSYSLTFYDAQSEPFAAITEGKLSIRNAVVEQSFTLGGFADEVLPDGSLVTRWQGR